MHIPSPCHLFKDFESLGQSLTYSIQIVYPEIQKQIEIYPSAEIFLCYILHEREGPGWTSIPKTIPELTAGMGNRKVELRAEKKSKGTKPSPYLALIQPQHTDAEQLLKNKTNPLKLPFIGQQANKPARKKGLLHRLLLVCLFCHTVQLARQIYQLVRHTRITHTKNINLFANTTVRLYFPLQRNVAMHHLYTPPPCPLACSSQQRTRHHHYRHIASSAAAAHVPVHTPLAALTSLLPPSHPAPSPPCLQAPAIHAQRLPVRSLLDHLQAAARRCLPSPSYYHPADGV